MLKLSYNFFDFYNFYLDFKKVYKLYDHKIAWGSLTQKEIKQCLFYSHIKFKSSYSLASIPSSNIFNYTYDSEKYFSVPFKDSSDAIKLFMLRSVVCPYKSFKVMLSSYNIFSRDSLFNFQCLLSLTLKTP